MEYSVGWNSVTFVSISFFVFYIFIFKNLERKEKAGLLKIDWNRKKLRITQIIYITMFDYKKPCIALFQIKDYDLKVYVDNVFECVSRREACE